VLFRSGFFTARPIDGGRAVGERVSRCWSRCRLTYHHRRTHDYCRGRAVVGAGCQLRPIALTHVVGVGGGNRWRSGCRMCDTDSRTAITVEGACAGVSTNRRNQRPCYPCGGKRGKSSVLHVFFLKHSSRYTLNVQQVVIHKGVNRSVAEARYFAVICMIFMP
jgi:hypothetical protein